MESNQRYYLRRASEERSKALRSITQEARDWHAKLASDFAERAAIATSAPMPLAMAGIAVSA